MIPTKSIKARPSMAAPAFALLLIGAPIAYLAGFDSAFNAATFGSAWVRVAGFCAVLTAGLVMAAWLNLSISPMNVTRQFAFPVAVSMAVAVIAAVIDAVLFRSVLPRSYVELFADPLGGRLAYFMLRAFNEEIFYRLFLTSLLICIGRALWLRPLPASGYWIAIIAAQAIAVCANSPQPAGSGLLGIAYIVIRFVSPGIVWGYLYWRHGFITGQVAHVSTHIFLQPLMCYILAH